ncbi:MAG: hypothetical protein OHK93_004844 [Ramalina farinacea]|uniref:Uncharacterized protein n=1 Tax=Ramalina farinacea TaxID=258253 RepID=A0AA43QUZ6_9LECA|nr:hypothetical protein [Ramalina farinacea]
MSDAQKYTSKLHGQRILIIGGTSGIGYAVAEASLEHGANVIISSSSPPASTLPSPPSANSTHPPPPPATRTASGDIPATSPPPTLLAQACPAEEEKLDHIVFTAGNRLAIGALKDISLDAIHTAGQVRFAGPLLLAKLAHPRYLAPGPRSSITLTTGVVSEKPIADWALNGGYGAGLHGVMRGLALDLRPVRVNLVSPGLVETELWDSLKESSGGAWEGMVGKWVGKMTTGVVGRVEDVAE